MFKRQTDSYGKTQSPETPYRKAGQVWDERIGSARLQARNWRLAALGALMLSLVLASGIVWQAGQSRIVPYVVEVDAQGAARAVAPAVQAYAPSDAQIAHHLAVFIDRVRSLSTDPVVVRRNWLRAYDYATDRAAITLNEYARDHDPFARIGRESVAVEVTSVVRASDTSFELRWIERTYDHGALARSERYTAVLGIVVQAPRDAATLRKNPLGIYVHGLNWSRDLVTGG